MSVVPLFTHINQIIPKQAMISWYVHQTNRNALQV